MSAARTGSLLKSPAHFGMAVMVSKTALGIAAGICGSLFIGYCIYFDRKRRNDPLFKKKLKERRARAKKQDSKNVTQMPDLKDHDAVQRFFLQEIQLGEELLAQDDLENGVEHLSNAVALCGQPQQLLQVLQQTLPPQVFNMLLQRLPVVSQLYRDIIRQIAMRGLYGNYRLQKYSAECGDNVGRDLPVFPDFELYVS